ncbi:non-ribosomal peptide synthetase module [Anaerobacillus alkalilacustris]|uniref:Non-ribosomal peptide synthetase module n=1 Tax=Anaerobacillus alkalilacustris TaxID=393763 RepID=A0A1S2LY80_9BACI|nr:DUF6063 family protein [Anaerobacillus alkalilacustris]OIJ17190.1 non-ribosomal peptide synthetase module [Anaerobacillus alkalilacustris]
MDYSQEEVMMAFQIYAKISRKGYSEADELRVYLAEDKVRGLVDQFAREVDCTIFSVGERLYFVPLAMNSPFHISNDTLKKTFFTGKTVNADIYFMYVTIIILFGEFYDSYQTTEATRDFISMTDWLLQVNERLETLQAIGKEDLKELEKEYEYNWSAIIEKWSDLDDLKETAKAQTGRTISRLSFLHTVKRFLEAQELVQDIGNDELQLTEKAKVIIQRYYMELEYNRGILEFIYSMERPKEEA